MFTDGPIKGAWESPFDQVEVENEALHNARDGCNSQLSTERHWLCTEIFVVFLFFLFFFFTIFTTWNFLLFMDPGD